MQREAGCLLRIPAMNGINLCPTATGKLGLRSKADPGASQRNQCQYLPGFVVSKQDGFIARGATGWGPAVRVQKVIQHH